MVAPLLAVVLLFRSKGAFSDLPHVVNSVSLFLDSSVELPLCEACKLGSIKLLDRIWDSSENFANCTHNFRMGTFTIRKFIRTDKHYRQHQFTFSMLIIVKEQNLEMVQWLADKFQGCRVIVDVVMAAAESGSTEILQFFYDQDNSSLDESLRVKMGLQVEWTGGALSSAASAGHGDVVWWLHSHIVTGFCHMVAIACARWPISTLHCLVDTALSA
ncbi:hypothetical protein PR001_g16762 [Phytophthora rubi]|uniref:Uncharacterized protein n=1 Tax=Phytophthora rubi TaxID=129364 RepID=A0A6A3KLH0_9STRA|nr:hypothetical protein PR001_g16762 [Phytophthora rubi]